MASNESNANHGVLPTQAWTAAKPESGTAVSGLRIPAPQGSARLGNYVYLSTQSSNNGHQMYVQPVLVESPGGGIPWTALLQGSITPLVDGSGAPMCCDGAPAACTIGDTLFLFYGGASKDTHLYLNRFNGSVWSTRTVTRAATAAELCAAACSINPRSATTRSDSRRSS